MVRKILPGNGDTSNIMSPLIPFNMIIDTDAGLLSTVLKSYLDPKVFNKGFFEDCTVIDLVYRLYTREKENPLYLCINTEYESSCDGLYEELIKDKYSDILELSVKTEFYKLISYFNLQSIETTIVCDRQEEIDLLKAEEVTKNNNVIFYDKLAKEDILKFNQFYFKYIRDANRYLKYMIDKSVYFANYRFNRTLIDECLDETLIELSKNNILNIIDIFNEKTLKERRNEN